MMNFELRLSSEAESCIDEQLQWYEASGKYGGGELAARWLDLLATALNTLSQHPQRYGFAPENGRWVPGIAIRQMRFKPWKTPSAWRVLYVIDEKAKLVTVLQVRHENALFWLIRVSKLPSRQAFRECRAPARRVNESRRCRPISRHDSPPTAGERAKPGLGAPRPNRGSPQRRRMEKSSPSRRFDWRHEPIRFNFASDARARP